MANGSDKPGPARADALRDRRAHAQEESQRAIRALRDSVDLEPEEASRLMIEVSDRRRSWSESLRPKTPRGIVGLVASALIALAALAEAVHQAFGGWR